MKRIVVLTGAGISKESGVDTFRDSNGLWGKYNVKDVASPEGWKKNPQLVLDFYNERRKKLQDVKPNKAHKILAELTEEYNVNIITQNVDNLHERAGSRSVLHLHGELLQAISTNKENKDIYEITEEDNFELNVGDTDEKGVQLRPNIVWFGEPVNLIREASKLVRMADIFIVIGTSLEVFPAASLLNDVQDGVPVYIINPDDTKSDFEAKYIKEKATVGMEILKEKLIK